MRPLVSSLAIAALALGLVACPKRTTRDLPEYQLGEGDLYLGGTVVDLYERAVLNRRDFVYSLDIDPTSRQVAFAHMVLTDFELSMYSLDDARKTWQVALHPTEFDVEGLAFVGDRAVALGARRSALSNHPDLRLHDAQTGAERARYHGDDERGYAQIAVSPDLRLLAGVTAKDGLLELHDAGGLDWLGEARAHRGPATAVAFGSDGTIYTGGQDRSLAVWRLEPQVLATSGQARLARLLVGEAKQRAMVVSFDGRANGVVALGTGASYTVVTSALASKLGLQRGAEQVTVRLGSTEIPAPRALVPSLRFKQLVLTEVAVAVCDECVPVGCDAALGQELGDRVRVSDGPLPHVVTVELGAPATPGLAPARPPVDAAPPPDPSGAAGDVAPAGGELLRPVLVRRHELPGAVNEIRVSRDGRRLVVALSAQPAERTLALYENEKAGRYPEPSPANAAVLLDAASGAVLKSFSGHRGYVVTADLSPDGRTLASGGWDNRLRLFDVATGAQVLERELSWLVRRVRFSGDGRTLAVAAWTPPASAGGDSEPAAILYDVVYASPIRTPRSKP